MELRRPLNLAGEASRSLGQSREFFTVAAIVCAFAISPLVRAEESAPMLRWMTKDGHSFQARFVRLQGTAIVVARDGFEFTVSIFALSPMSLEQARRQAIQAPVALPVAPVASIAFGPSVLTFCQDQLGKKIGDGECAALAAAALRNAGAAVRGGTDSPGEGDYVWGELIAFIEKRFFGLKGIKELSQVEAGDIVQFHNTRFSGFNHVGDGIYHFEARHHTAVVESVDPARKTVSVLQQNWHGEKTVRRQTLYLRGMIRGWLRFYRAVPTT